MQILIFSLLILLLIVYLVFKVKKRFTKKDFNLIIGIIIASIVGTYFYFDYENNKIPNTFKAKYLQEKNIKIDKLEFYKTSVEVVASNKSTYSFSYIINKDGTEYVCEVKDLEVQIIQNEIILGEIKEKCQEK
ncbi:MAG: hypothetical protein ABF301_07890 [Sulfurovum sp.]|jgi:hypothetical protein